MAQILVRNLAAKVVNRMKAKAKKHNRSLEAEVKTVIEREAEKADWDDWLKEAERIRKSFGDQVFSPSADLIREGREER